MVPMILTSADAVLRDTSWMSLWDEQVRDVRQLAVADRQRLVQFLTDLTDEEWLAPTAAPGWTVKDIALHLLDDDMTWLSTQRDGDLRNRDPGAGGAAIWPIEIRHARRRLGILDLPL